MNYIGFGFGASLTVLLLLVGHWFPWPRELPRLRAYIYGVASIALGFTVWRALLADWWTVAGLWLLAALGGGAVHLAYWIDDRVRDHHKARLGEKLLDD